MICCLGLIVIITYYLFYRKKICDMDSYSNAVTSMKYNTFNAF